MDDSQVGWTVAADSRRAARAGWLGALGASAPPVACSAMLIGAAGLFAFGFVRLYANPATFASWIAEDGVVEWATWAGLVAMTAVAAARAGAGESAAVRTVWMLIALAAAFGAFEEISWGQRLFGWHSPSWFEVHNAQHETNFHNLVFGGISINRLIFGKLLGALVLAYLIALPVAYRTSAAARRGLDRYALPVPQVYQVLLALGAVALRQAAVEHNGKVGELQELVLVAAFLAVVSHPLNERAMPIPAWYPPLRRAATATGSIVAGWVGALPVRVRLIATPVVVLVALLAAFRLAFAAAFEPPAFEVPIADVVRDRGIPALTREWRPPGTAADLAHAWWLGAKFDLRVTLLLMLPLTLLSWLRPLDPLRRVAARQVWLLYLTVTAAALLVVHAVDLGHYAYERRRLDAALLDHLIDADVAAGMVWQTYPVVWIIAGLCVILAAYVGLVRSSWARTARAARPGRSGRGVIFGVVAMLLYALGLYGKWSWYPLRWSDAHFAPNEYLSTLAANPVHNVFDTLPTRGASVDAAGARAAYPVVAAALGLPPAGGAAPSLERYVLPAEAPGDPPNVVVIFLESFAAHKTGAFGNPAGATPAFDALARESLLFSRFYASAMPTARSIFTTLFGIPDVNPVVSASRNPRVIAQRTIANAFDGYAKHYFIGGSASWANIRGMLLRNIPGLRLHEEGEFAAPRSDVWGISDLHLFEAAEQVLRAEREPFLAFVQSAGNHRPYTIPEDSRGFSRRPADPAALQRAGFDSQEAYDGLRFMDHSLARFFELARAAPYHGRTIFVLLGDHGTAESRVPEIEAELRERHVPLVIHAPALLGAGARSVDHVASSVDVLPTIAGLAGIPYRNTTLGRNLLAPATAAAPLAFIAAGPTFGVLDEAYYLRMDGSGRRQLFRQQADASLDPEELSAREPQRAAEMARLATALRDASHWMLQHNAP